MSNVSLDVYSEQGLLAGMVSNPETISEIVSILSMENFSVPKHSIIFDALKKISEQNKEVSVVNLAYELRERGQLTRIGGVEFLASFYDPEGSYALYADPITYAQIVLEESKKREIEKTLLDSLEKARLDSGIFSDELISQVGMKLNKISLEGSLQSSTYKVSDILDETLEDIKQRKESGSLIQGIPTGFNELDEHTSGFMPGQFIIVAGRPSEGKSTLAMDFVRAASMKAGKTSLFFSLEMSKKELMERVLSAESNVLLTRIKQGNLDEVDWESIAESHQNIKDSNLIIDDTADITIEHIRNQSIKQLQRPEGLDLVVVDYLQLMGSTGAKESRQQEVSNFSRSLKLLARELGVPVVGISQLNRNSEARSNKKPVISDLRESGSLEQDCDIAILIWRHDGGEESTHSGTSLILAKNRNGMRDVTIPLAPLLEYAKFTSGSGMFPPVLEDEVPPDPEGYADDGQTPPPVGATAW